MSDNRARLIVTAGGPWRLYTHPLPGMEMLGTVQRGMEIGALTVMTIGFRHPPPVGGRSGRSIDW